MIHTEQSEALLFKNLHETVTRHFAQDESLQVFALMTNSLLPITKSKIQNRKSLCQ